MCVSLISRLAIGMVLIALGVTQPSWVEVHAAGEGWYSSWQLRKTITIDATKVSSGPHSNFPVLINLSSDASLAANAQADGDDILFTSSDGTTKLSHEIEKYTSATGELVAWVKVPSLPSTSNTVLYMYYGNASAASQQDATNVWDTNFKAVLHMKEDPSGTAPQILDSTSNANQGSSQGSMTSGDLIPAKIGNGLDLDGTDDYISATNSASLDITGNLITMQAWVRMPVPNAQDSPFIVKGPSMNTERYMLGVDGGVTPAGINHRVTTADGHFRYDTGGMSNETWHFVVGVYEGTLASNPRFRVYMDGALVSGNNASGNILTTTEPVQFGKRVVGDDRWYNGDLDELRISDIVRSAAWILTEYNNQNSPSTFYTVGAATSSPDKFFLLFE